MKANQKQMVESKKNEPANSINVVKWLGIEWSFTTGMWHGLLAKGWIKQ